MKSFSRKVIEAGRSAIHFFAICLCILLSPLSLLLKLCGYRVFVTGTVIGHFTIEPETYLKENILNNRSSRKIILFPPFKPLLSKRPWQLDACNEYMAKIWKQQFIVITNPLIAFFLYPILGAPFLKKPLIFRSHFLCHYPNYWSGGFSLNKGLFDVQHQYHQKYPNFGKLEAFLSIPEKDQKKGWEMLQKWGLKEGDWFVCFNAREPGHYNASSQTQETLRNADVNRYLKALALVMEKGGWCIRVGSSKMAPLPEAFRKYPKMIDYPHTEELSAFMDIFLCANCRFFIGGASGITLVSGLFGVPSVVANLVPLGVLPPYPKDICIQKRYYSSTKQRYLQISEIVHTELFMSHTDADFAKEGVQLIENSEEEIYEAVSEILARLDGNYLEDQEANDYNKEFKKALPLDAWGKRFNGKLGDAFLKKCAKSLSLKESPTALESRVHRQL